MIYFKKVENIIKKNKSNLIIGLDPDIRKIPRLFSKKKYPELEFNKSIISITKNFVAGYKLNLAFYEVLGKYCYETIAKTLECIPKEMIKICDGKRGDIGNTGEYYAKTYLDDFNFDSITVNPYMGRDSLEPFLNRKNRGIYVLALTSNKGYSDFQMQKFAKKNLYEDVLAKCIKWSKYNQIGFVIGANHIKVIKKVTTKYPKISILIPGVGAQGNDLNILLKNIRNNYFLINVSRSIIYDSEDFSCIKDFEDNLKNRAMIYNELINKNKLV